MTIATTEERVARGAALLDVRMPGWADLILSKAREGKLGMGRCTVCVLGHLFGDYYIGLDKLGDIGEDSGHYGFNGWDIFELQRAWIREAEARVR